MDLEHLYQSGEHTDCLLVFTGQPRLAKHNINVIRFFIAGDKNVPSISSPVQLSCHKAILCARSPFFRNLVSRRLVAQQTEKQDRGLNIPQPLKIILDETVIPQKYSRVLVRALYVDSIDFDLVDDKHVEIGDRVRDAMELYQIGRFLDLDILSQNCEDAIVQRLNQDNIADVLEWSSQPYGSPWVNRQANQFLLEDFAHIALSPALDKINKETLRSVLTSDFVQASEAEILGAIIKWGEMTVARRGEAGTGDHAALTHTSEQACSDQNLPLFKILQTVGESEGEKEFTTRRWPRLCVTWWAVLGMEQYFAKIVTNCQIFSGWSTFCLLEGRRLSARRAPGASSPGQAGPPGHRTPPGVRNSAPSTGTPGSSGITC